MKAKKKKQKQSTLNWRSDVPKTLFANLETWKGKRFTQDSTALCWEKKKCRKGNQTSIHILFVLSELEAQRHFASGALFLNV